ncbi:hypothetical protein L7F22_021400 [Adiantum nelumboides]|nr:hypothetical protein [Adiantum nelumboides]
MEQLPKEVLENVLCRLSVYDIIRAGCACKVLRALVSSYTFTSSHSHISPLLLIHQDSQLGPERLACAYDADRASWLTLSLAFLQPNFPEFAYPVASDGGLLCFGSGGDFIACNPINKSWRRFPSLTQIDQQFDEDSVQGFGLKFNATSGTYEFYLLNYCTTESESTSRLMSFSSSSSQWRSLRPLVMPGTCTLHSNAIIFCGSRLYTLWHREGSLSVFAFDNGFWSELDVPECISTLLKAFLMDVYGSLYMVGGVGAVWLRDNFWQHPTSIRIWKMHAQSNAWVEVTRMPAAILHEFQERINFEELQCWGKNGIMYMKSLQSDVLMFSLCANEWKWLKNLEMDVETLALIFEPTLSAMA